MADILSWLRNRTVAVSEDSSGSTQFFLAGLLNQFGGSTPVISQIRTISNELFDLPATGYVTIPAKYGSWQISANGTYKYIADKANSLSAGQVVTETFSSSVTIGTKKIEVSVKATITGTNDQPIATVDIGNVTEDQTLTVSASQGVLSNDRDVDALDQLKVTAIRSDVTNQSGAVSASAKGVVTGEFGTLTMNADGSYSYQANGAKAQALSAGATATDTFMYTVSDGKGGSSITSLSIKITGTNDSPTATADIGNVQEDQILSVAAAQGVLSNDKEIDASDQIKVASIRSDITNVSSGVGVGQSGVVAGVFGTLTMNIDGSYNYQATGSKAQNLKAGETATDTFVYSIVDSQGARSVSSLTIKITGTNDSPSASADSVTVSAGDDVVRGASQGVLLNDKDVDGDTLTIVGVAAGNATPLSTGLNNKVLGTYGELTLHAEGNYEYRANTASSKLAAGVTAQDVFTYQISDGKGGVSTTTLTIVIGGTQGSAAEAAAPTVIGSSTPTLDPVATRDTDSVLENNQITRQATTGLLVNDADSDKDVLTVVGVATGVSSSVSGYVAAPLTGTYGTLTVTSDGAYSYTANTPAANALKAGETKADVFSYKIDDGNGYTSTTTLTITVTGANDAPIATVDVGSVNENATVSVAAAQGLLSNDSDVDGDRLTVTGVGSGTTAPSAANLDKPLSGVYGSLVVASDGSYSYVADKATANALKAGETQKETFTYQISDGQGGTSTATLTLTVTGTNDAPVATLDLVEVHEGGSVINAANTGLLANDSDPDQDALTVVAVGIEGNTPNMAGLNVPLTGTYGTLILASDGSYSYYANTAAANQLKEGEVQTESFVYQITDGKGGLSLSSLVLSITGTNDEPVATADSVSVSSQESIMQSATSGLLANDLDIDGDTLVISAVGTDSATLSASNLGQQFSGSYGHLTLNNDGSYTYVPDKTAGLSSGQTANDVFTYQISDGHGGVSTSTLTINVTKNGLIGSEGGTNMRPIAVADFALVAEDATVTVSAADGVLQNDSDLNNDRLIVVNVGAGTSVPTLNLLGTPVAGSFGHLLLHSDGSYSYTADATLADKLAVGQVATDTFTYVVSDGHGGTSNTTLSIMVTGTNDEPVANARVHTAGNNAFFTTDIDRSAAELAGTSGQIGGGVIGEEALSKTFDFGIANAGKTVRLDLSMLELNSWDGGWIAEHQAIESFYVFANGQKVLDQILRNDAFTDAAGNTLDDAGAAINNIGDTRFSDEAHDFTVQVTLDAQGQVRIGFGSSLHQDYMDEAWAIDKVSLTLSDTGEMQIDNFSDQGYSWKNNMLLTNHISDVDDGSARLIGVVAGVADSAQGGIGLVIEGHYGTLTLNADGSYQYAADSSRVGNLALGQWATDVFTYTVADHQGAISSSTISVNLMGTVSGNTPFIGNTTGDVVEDTSLTSEGLVTATDGSLGFIAQTATTGLFGTFTLHSNGSWSYTLNNNNSVVQGLDSNQELADNFVVSTANGQTNTIAITVHGLDAIPEGTSKTIMYGNETGLYQVSASDFGFQANEDGSSLAGVRILNLSSGVTGFILHNGQQQPLPINEFISVEDIEAGRVFLTGLSPNGVSTGNVSFEVQDSNGNLDPTPNMLTLNCVHDQSPLILDLDGNGVQTVGLSANIHFDINADGTREQTGWVGANDALLVVDRNQNGSIDDGSELFGNNTRLANGDKAANGFAALADYDSNQDGIIDANDEKFSQIKLWRDANQDGKSDASELFGLETAGVHSLNLDFTQSDKVVEGNRYAQVGSYTTTAGTSAEMTDVWFSTKTEAAKPKNLDIQDLFHHDEQVPLPAAAEEATNNPTARPATTLGNTDHHAVDPQGGLGHQELHHLMQELLHKPQSLD